MTTEGSPPPKPEAEETRGGNPDGGFLHRMFYRFCYLLSRLLCAPFPVHGHDAGKVPKTGGVLLASNHQSFLDPPIVGTRVWRPVHYMARNTLFHGLLGFVIRRLNSFPVDRDHADPTTLKEALRRLRSGAALLVFPEGTRTPDGLLQPLLPGIGMLALRAGVPVVPVFIHGAFQAWPRDRKVWRYFHPVHVFFGDPIEPTQAVEGGRRREQYERFVKELESRLREMEREAHRRCPLPSSPGVRPPA